MKGALDIVLAGPHEACNLGAFPSAPVLCRSISVNGRVSGI